MPGIVSRTLSENQLAAFQQALELGWKELEDAKNNQEKIALLRADLSGLARIALQIPSWLELYWESVADLVAARQIVCYDQTGLELKKNFDLGLVLLARVADLLQTIEKHSGVGNGGSPLRPAIAEIQSQKEEVSRQAEARLKHWPFFTSQSSAETRQEIDQGDLLELEDAFAAAAGMDRASFLDKVKKRRTQSA